MRMLWVMMGMFVPFVAPSLTLKRCPCVTSVNCNIVRIAFMHLKGGGGHRPNSSCQLHSNCTLPTVAVARMICNCRLLLCRFTALPTIPNRFYTHLSHYPVASISIKQGTATGGGGFWHKASVSEATGGGGRRDPLTRWSLAVVF